MNWKDIKVNETQTGYTHHGITLYDKTYFQVLKFHEPGLAPVQDEEGWYHINVNGEPHYKKRYRRVFGYYFNRAAVVGVNGFFHIDETGNTLYSDRYSWCGNYQEETCVVRDREGSSLYLDLNGKPLFNRKFLYAGDFKDGYACIKTEKGWTHINLTGNLLHGKYFSDLGVYHKGFATARDDKGWFHVDRSGTPLYQERYQMVEPFYNGVALVWENEWRMKFICKE